MKSPKIRFKGGNGRDAKKMGDEISPLYVGESFSNCISENGKFIVMDMGSVDSEGKRIEKKKTNKERDLLQKGDLVMPKDDIGGGLIIGKTAYIPCNNKYVLGDHVFKLSFKKINSLFIHYLINGPIFNKQIKINVTGSAQLGLRGLYVENSIVNVPDTSEQQKIGTFFEQIDSQITKNESKLQKLKQLKESFLQKMFPKDGASVPEMRFKGFEGEREVKKFGDFGSVSMCKRIFKDETKPEGEIPFFKIGTFGSIPDAFISRKLFNEYKANFSYPKEGDILLSASGTIGKAVEYHGEEVYFQDSNIVWLTHNKFLSNKFLKILYQIIKREGIEGSTIKRLYNENFLRTSFMISNITEQEKIGTFFEKIDLQIKKHQEKLQKLKLLKQSLLEKMFI